MAVPFPICFFNKQYIPLEDARVSVLDRGFLFADSVYEVIPVYSGRTMRIDAHIARFRRSMDAIVIEDPQPGDGWIQICAELVTRNNADTASIYIQISRGATDGRDHVIPSGLTPTVFAMCTPMNPLAGLVRDSGIKAITLADNRWGRCDIKSNALLANVLLRQAAEDAGAQEAILTRDGYVTEGSSSSVFIVSEGCLLTPPDEPAILPGTTRDLVLELADEAGIPRRSSAVSVASLKAADEVWISSAAREVVPVTMIDGVPVADGRPGKLWKKIDAGLQEYKNKLTSSSDPR